MGDVLLVTFPGTSCSPVRCSVKPRGSCKSLRHWVWPVHLYHSRRLIWQVESRRIAEQWTMVSFAVSTQTSGQQLSQNGKVSLLNWTIHCLTMGREQTHGLEMMAIPQVLGHWCKVMLFLKDEVGRLLDTDKSAPLSVAEALEKELNCSSWSFPRIIPPKANTCNGKFLSKVLQS